MLLVRSRDDDSAIEAIDADGSRSDHRATGSGKWLGTTLKFTINEARAARPGNAAMLGRLTELMFVEILREYMHRLPPITAAGSRTERPYVGKALRLLHADPVATGPSMSSRAKSRCRGRCWRSDSPTGGRDADALPRQLADAAGQADDARGARATFRRSRRASATNPRLPSTARSSAQPDLRLRRGAKARSAPQCDWGDARQRRSLKPTEEWNRLGIGELSMRLPTVAVLFASLFAIAPTSQGPSPQAVPLRLISTSWTPFTNEAGQPRFALDLVEAALGRSRSPQARPSSNRPALRRPSSATPSTAVAPCGRTPNASVR